MSTANKILMGASGGGGPVGPSDDEFNRVSFLSHFDGANNGVNNAFDDGSTSNHTITANGNVTQGSFGPFARPDGEWGWNFDGSGDYVAAATSTDWQFGSGNFTVEFWTFPLATGNWVIAHGDGTVAGSSISWQYGHGTFDFYYGSSYVQITSPTLTLNTWQHIAVVRNGATITVYKDGTSTGTANIGSNTLNTGGTTPFYIGGYPDAAGAGINGVISNVRVVKGTAVYTGNFTPSTSKLTAITNTKLLTCQSNRFLDNSSSGHTITPYGNAAVSAFGPFLTSSVYDPAVNGASAYFDGDGDSLVLADSSDFELGSGDFTIAMWVYPDDLTPPSRAYNNIALMMHSTYSGTAVGWSMFWQTASPVTNSFRFMVNGSSRIYDAEGFFGRQWTYLTAVRTGDTLKLFINGVEKVSTSFADFSNSTTTLTIGASPNWQSDVYKFDGKMCDVFICKGTAVYTGNFTPPTAPLTAITNTKLLLNMADGQAIDSAAQSNLTLIGNANTSTDQAKFGNTSLHLSGGDGEAKANISGDIVNFGTGDFTYEGFFRIASVGSSDIYFFDGRDGTGGVMPNILFDVSDGNRVRVFTSVYVITGATPISLNTWYHLALCRSGTSLKLFLNGTQEGSTFSDTSNYIAGSFASIGGLAGSTAGSFRGFIDDFRISKFARYTANFTAPTEPFPDKGQ